MTPLTCTMNMYNEPSKSYCIKADGKTSIFKLYGHSFENGTILLHVHCTYGCSKTCVIRPLSIRPKIGFLDQLLLNAGQSIAECPKGGILQYFRPSLSYHLLLRYLSCLILSGHFTHVLLYLNCFAFQLAKALW